MGAAWARRLHSITDSAVHQLLDAVDGEGRAGAVLDEAFTAFVVVGRDAHAAVDVEAVARRGEAAGLLVEALVVAFGRGNGTRAREEGAVGERDA